MFEKNCIKTNYNLKNIKKKRSFIELGSEDCKKF